MDVSDVSSEAHPPAVTPDENEGTAQHDLTLSQQQSCDVLNTSQSSVLKASNKSSASSALEAYKRERAAAVADRQVLEDTGEAGRALDGHRWRRRLGLSPDTRVFICSVSYPDWRAALLRRGWKQNPDFYSPHFNLKLTLKTHHVGFTTLMPGQSANHYRGSGALCTKHGLVHLLRDVQGVAPARSETFFPRAYDLGIADDYSAFIEEHRAVAAEGVLRTIVLGVLTAAVKAGVLGVADLLPPSSSSSSSSTAQPPSGPSPAPSSQQLEAALQRCLYLPPSILVPLLTGSGPGLVGKALTHFACGQGAGVAQAHAPKWNLGVLQAALAVTRRRCPTWSDEELDTPPLAAHVAPGGTPLVSTAPGGGYGTADGFGGESLLVQQQAVDGGSSSGGDDSSQLRVPAPVTAGEASILRWCDVRAPGGPAEQGPARRAREERERDQQAVDNAARDRLVSRLMRKDPAQAAAILKSSASLASAALPLPDSAAALLNDSMQEQGEGSSSSSSGSDSSSEGGSSSEDEEALQEGSRMPSHRAAAGGQARRSQRRKGDKGTDAGDRVGMEAAGTISGLDPARLRAWRVRLARDRNGAPLPSALQPATEGAGGSGSGSGTGTGTGCAAASPAGAGGGSPTEPAMSLSASSAAGSSLRIVQYLTPALWRAVIVAVGHVNDDRPGAPGAACQASLNGCPPRNVWIVKPAGKSRGRGIECEWDLAHILNRRGGAGHRETHWIVQKYIERPLLIHGRKWDIRQWVLVTSWAPLTVWFYDRCYLRFCAYPFTLDNLGNRFIHLSNNSVQKHSGAFDAGEGVIGKGNMWHCDRFASWLQSCASEGAFDGLQYTPVAGNKEGFGAGWDMEEERGQAPAPVSLPVSTCPSIWSTVLQPQLRRVVTWSLLAAQESMAAAQATVPAMAAPSHSGGEGSMAAPPASASSSASPATGGAASMGSVPAGFHPHTTPASPLSGAAPYSSWELYGYDFMVDADLRPWLIEVNSSPDFSYSTPVTAELVRAACEDSIKVAVDHAEWQGRKAEYEAYSRRQARLAKRGGGAAAAAAEEASTAGGVEDPGPAPSTGGWQCIYRAPPGASAGVALTCAAHGLAVTGKGIAAAAPTRGKWQGPAMTAVAAAARVKGASDGGGGGGGVRAARLLLQQQQAAAAAGGVAGAATPEPVLRRAASMALPASHPSASSTGGAGGTGRMGGDGVLGRAASFSTGTLAAQAVLANKATVKASVVVLGLGLPDLQTANSSSSSSSTTTGSRSALVGSTTTTAGRTRKQGQKAATVEGP